MNYRMNENLPAPRTTRVYLQPPLAERVILMMPNFRVTDHELSEKKYHVGQNASGFLVLHGKTLHEPDFRKVTFSPVEGGYPLYTLNEGDERTTKLSMQAFSSFDRVPVTYARITVTNNNNYPIEDALGILPRSADNDNKLVGYHDTGYSVFRPDWRNWLVFLSRHEICGTRAKDEFSELYIKNGDWRWVTGDAQPLHHEPFDFFRTDFRLEPGESVHFDLCFACKEAPEDFDYEDELRAFRKRWDSELSGIKKTPNTTSPRLQSMFRHAAAQCLQMLARYEGSDLITARQGDIGRYIWPWEAAFFLTALDRIGLTRYTGDAYRAFIRNWMRTEGEDDGKIMSEHQQWGNLNGAMIWGISQHLLYTQDKAEFLTFKDDLERMLGWMERERERSVDDENSRYKHIFPVGKSCDWGQLAQNWCFTDSQNVMGEACMARLYEFFKDEKAGMVKACAESYRDAVKAVMADLYRGHENDECFMFPHMPGVPFKETLTYCYYTAGAPFLLLTGFIDPNSKEFEQMEAYFAKHGLFENAFAGRMSNIDDGDVGLYGEMYYTVCGEVMWLEAWLRRGEKEKADEAFHALLRYGVTSEFVVSERYTPLDEWYAPWQPNASGTGRLLHVLLDYYY